MVNIKMDCLYDAIQAFEKLNSVVPNIPEVLYKIAKLHEEIRDYDNTIKYFSLLLAQIPNDPILLYNIGLFYYKLSVFFNFNTSRRKRKLLFSTSSIAKSIFHQIMRYSFY